MYENINGLTCARKNNVSNTKLGPDHPTFTFNRFPFKSSKFRIGYEFISSLWRPRKGTFQVKVLASNKVTVSWDTFAGGSWGESRIPEHVLLWCQIWCNYGFECGRCHLAQDCTDSSKMCDNLVMSSWYTFLCHVNVVALVPLRLSCTPNPKTLFMSERLALSWCLDCM